MQIDMSQFRAAFYVEAAEHLQHMEAALLQLENAPRDTELLNTIFRGAHSIKGASTTFGIDEVGRFTHVLENLLERLRDGVVDTTSELIELLLTSVDVIDGLVANAKDGSPVPENMEQVLAELKRANGQPATESAAKNIGDSSVAVDAAQGYRISIQPSKEFFALAKTRSCCCASCSSSLRSPRSKSMISRCHLWRISSQSSATYHGHLNCKPTSQSNRCMMSSCSWTQVAIHH